MTTVTLEQLNELKQQVEIHQVLIDEQREATKLIIEELRRLSSEISTLRADKNA